MMVHNYYLYEQDGQLAIIPWDYNLAFGGMNAEDTVSLINSPIDSPVSSGDTSDRPLISWIFESEDATAKYHEVYNQFITTYVDSGWLASEITRVVNLIRPYVEADEHAFYTVEEFDKAVDTLQTCCTLRSESIRAQLDGSIPSTTSGQLADSAALVNTGELDISSMGSMGIGGGFGGDTPAGQMPSAPSFDNFPDTFSEDSAATQGGFPSVGPSFDNFPNFQSDAPINPGESGSANAWAFPDTAKNTGNSPFGQGNMPGAFPSAANDSLSWLELSICAILLLLAIAFVSRVPRHNR